MATSHSIVLTSALCKDTYPDNHGGDFVNTLNTPLELNEPGQEWVVLLSEISYLPDSWYNVRNGNNEITFSMHSFPCKMHGSFTFFVHELSRYGTRTAIAYRHWGAEKFNVRLFQNLDKDGIMSLRDTGYPQYYDKPWHNDADNTIGVYVSN